jgi:rod shape-determining protein MreC
MNVISGSGLVGIVTEVGSNWATVRSIIDDNSSVSAMVSTTSDQCIVAGNLELLDDGALNIVRLTDADNKVHVGDKVVTSYISEKYLPGILIGYISELSNDSNNMTKSGYLTPVVDFRHLQEVLVILELKDYDPSDADEVADTDVVSAVKQDSGTQAEDETEDKD